MVILILTQFSKFWLFSQSKNPENLDESFSVVIQELLNLRIGWVLIVLELPKVRSRATWCYSIAKGDCKRWVLAKISGFCVFYVAFQKMTDYFAHTSVFLDVGARIGVVWLISARISPGGSVYAPKWWFQLSSYFRDFDDHQNVHIMSTSFSVVNSITFGIDDRVGSAFQKWSIISILI